MSARGHRLGATGPHAAYRAFSWRVLQVLFVFDPWRSAILLAAGDKSGNLKQWYREAIPRAEQLLEIYLKERAEEEGGV